jgi:hypothetical protein
MFATHKVDLVKRAKTSQLSPSRKSPFPWEGKNRRIFPPLGMGTRKMAAKDCTILANAPIGRKKLQETASLYRILRDEPIFS